MALISQNLFFVQNAQKDSSWLGQAKYQIAGRITTLGISLMLMAETIVRATLAALAMIAFIATGGMWDCAIDFSARQATQAKIAGRVSLDCLISVFSLNGLANRLIAGPLKGTFREHRIRVGEELIQAKLKKEYLHAQNQMRREVDGPAFRYLENKCNDENSTETEQIGEYDVGIFHTIGRRKEMEDTHLATSFDLKINGKEFPVRLFGIFDGHGGDEASKYLKNHLGEQLEKTLVELNPKGLTDEGIWNALKLTFVRLNDEFKKESGSTATVAMILDGKLWTANVGDSRTILENGNETIQLSEDAKPSDERYQKGIKNRGGYVIWVGISRVNGQIGVARAFGDHSLLGAMSARPKITAVPLKEIKPGSNLFLACDGIYDVASTRQVGKCLQDHRQEIPAILARNIVFSAFQAKSTDNLSAMVVRFP